jgi:hypothetical protein
VRRGSGGCSKVSGVCVNVCERVCVRVCWGWRDRWGVEVVREG